MPAPRDGLNDLLLRPALIFGTLRDAGILHTVREGAGRRAAIYAFLSLITIAEGRTLL